MSLEKIVNILFQSVNGSVYPLTVVGISVICLLGSNSHSSRAQTPRRVAQIIKNHQNTHPANLFFVHPHIGNDSTGNGTENAPWQTITHALNNATSNSIIILADGTYSTQSGEVFPLIVKPGVAIQGNITNKGKSVIIHGGGQYLSRSFGSQNVAIVTKDQSRVSGVTVINNNSRGFGLWIESNNSIVQENIFTQNTQDGIAVAGNATANISNNYFYRNGANGITISGNARPEIRENVFQDTGFGINIIANAAPLITGNKIKSNRSGVIVQANSTPILRGNTIENNREDGLVVIAQGRPDLGSSNDPGRNLFKSNKRYDINAKSAKLVIFASGNNLATNRIRGKLDFSGVNRAKSQVDSQRQEKRNISPSKQTFQQPNNRSSNQLPPLPNSVINSNLEQYSPQKQAQLFGTNINSTQNDTGVIEFVAPQARKPTNLSQDLGTIKPNSNVKNNGEVETYQTYENPDPVVRNTGKIENFPRYRVSRTIPRYRVLVLVNNQQQMQLLSDLSKDAFPRVWRGQQVIQVAVFSNSDNARSMMMNLANRGLQAVIEPVN
ncbi:DUF1565 domain-containing protein [Anabaena sp. FACHB-1237]|uniref:DUF1565 domain-containing protein n=1 Tax=Anabaena sp. FACHB-1237 TaxID=2692769 RepID=UPI0016807CCF|nr:DUF1565 domain-containing protein [Anabaena sp. FACHB-1237]MBD2137477.1 DUF1565 domain-containing protein [Anabaena sp. FACHB-1237]